MKSSRNDPGSLGRSRCWHGSPQCTQMSAKISALCGLLCIRELDENRVIKISNESSFDLMNKSWYNNCILRVRNIQNIQIYMI